MELLAFSGHPAGAGDPLGAAGRTPLRAHRDHALFIKTDAGGFLDAATGKPAPDVMASGLKQVRMNNPVRGEIEAALGSLRLLAPEPAARMTAAEAVFHSHDPAALPALDKALAKETDPAVKQRMEQARAAALLFSTDATEKDRLAAVATIRARGDLDSRALARLADRTSRRRWPQRRAPRWPRSTACCNFGRLLQSVYYGLSLGSVLLLAAAGLAITFGVMGVINMAHGEMVMIGAYVTFVVQQVIRAVRPGPVRRQPADRGTAGLHRRRRRSASSSSAR